MIRGHVGKEVKDKKVFRGLRLLEQPHFLAILIARSQRPRGGPDFLETEKAQELNSVIASVAFVGFQYCCKIPICYSLKFKDVVVCIGHKKLGDDQLGGFHLLVLLKVSCHADVGQDSLPEEISLEI